MESILLLNATAAHLEWANTGEDSLCTIAKDSEHGKPTILELLCFQLLHGGFSFAQIEEVEELATCPARATFISALTWEVKAVNAFRPKSDNKTIVKLRG